MRGRNGSRYGRLILKSAIPLTVAIATIGRPLSALVSYPLTDPFQLGIVHIHLSDAQTVICFDGADQMRKHRSFSLKRHWMSCLRLKLPRSDLPEVDCSTSCRSPLYRKSGGCNSGAERGREAHWATLSAVRRKRHFCGCRSIHHSVSTGEPLSSPIFPRSIVLLVVRF